MWGIISTFDLQLNYQLLVILCSYSYYGKLNAVGLADPLSCTPPPEYYNTFKLLCELSHSLEHGRSIVMQDKPVTCMSLTINLHTLQ